MNRKAKRAAYTVGDVLRAVDDIAPLRAAAEWDNVGLLAGAVGWPAGDVLVAIDLTDAVASDILERGARTAIVYHPPIFKGIRRVTAEAECPTMLLPELLAARVSIIAVHTALDAAIGGTNDVLLDALNPVRRYPLEPVIADGRQFKLVVFVPIDEADALRAALAEAGAGAIGNYSECGFELVGRGSFRGNEGSTPTIGRRGVLERVDEARLEMVVSGGRLPAVVRAIYANHTYEEPAFDLYPLREVSGRGQVGLGRVGELSRPMKGRAIMRKLAELVDMSVAQVVGDLGRTFRSVTTAAGSFGVKAFRDPGSLVVTGELKHHDMVELVRRGITCVLLGHDRSERPTLARLAEGLASRVPELKIALSRADRSPNHPISK